jgi:molecular chaperone GrpE
MTEERPLEEQGSEQVEQGGDAEDRAAALEDQLKRVAADFDNFRKRVTRERAELATHANERLVKELLPVLDDLERALEAAARPEAPVRDSGPVEGDRGNREVPPTDHATLLDGVRLVFRSLAQVLERQGLSEISTEGKFDPHVHEALLSQPSDRDEGEVLDVLQKGYKLGERVLRPARVVVAAAPPHPPEDDED